jgi:hypothetical protein
MKNMRKILVVIIASVILIACKSVSQVPSSGNSFLSNWLEASNKSILDQMSIFKDSLYQNALINDRISLSSSITDQGYRNKFYKSSSIDSAPWGNEFYILETVKRGEVMEHDFYVQEKGQETAKLFHYNCIRTCLLVSSKTSKNDQEYSLEKLFNESNPKQCADYLPFESFIISHFKNNQIESKVYPLPCEATLFILGQAIVLF